jgi:PleD family two-component response regulator
VALRRSCRVDHRTGRLTSAYVELRALERDRRGRTLQAVSESTEARRSSDYFRGLSVRDPLTGLHNRRFMDSRLAELLAELGEQIRVTPVK